MTTSTASPQVRVSLRDPGQLLAALPALLGFRPAGSVVLVAHRPPEGNRVGVVLRGDLPPPGGERELAAHLAVPLVAADALGVTIAVVGRGPGQPGDTSRVPCAGLVGVLIDALGQAGLPTLHALWVPEVNAGIRYQCYSDSTCTGVLPEPSTTAVAAAVATTGRVTFSSREALESLLAPVDEATLARRSKLLNAASAAGDGRHRADERTERACRDVCAALTEACAGDVELDDDRAVRLGLALADTRVRDGCLVTALLPGSDTALAAERLWLALVRGLPAPERADAACLLGYSAYLRGEGALAGIAFENALKADPAHVLAGLLVRSLKAGLPPARMEQVARSADILNLERPFGDAEGGDG